MSRKENLVSLIISLSESLYEEWTPFVPSRYIVPEETDGCPIISEEVLLQSTEEELFSLLNIFTKLKEKDDIQEERKKLSCFMDAAQRAKVIKALVHYGPPETDYQLPDNDIVKHYASFADGTYGIIGWDYHAYRLERASDEELVELLLVTCKYLQDKCDKYFPSYDRECLEALIGEKRGNAE